jgi:hypothetical protein
MLTSLEKLRVLFSIIKQVGTIDWKSIDLPEGRSLKAVRHMLDAMRKRVQARPRPEA